SAVRFISVMLLMAISLDSLDATGTSDRLCHLGLALVSDAARPADRRLQAFVGMNLDVPRTVDLRFDDLRRVVRRVDVTRAVDARRDDLTASRCIDVAGALEYDGELAELDVLEPDIAASAQIDVRVGP